MIFPLGLVPIEISKKTRFRLVDEVLVEVVESEVIVDKNNDLMY